jgi:8-oxo-dGTP pyrophosphatase MutT (NUDIX family)
MVPVREAATVMLVRDDPDLHVFMMRKSPTVVFTPGAYVFPGGAVDAADRDEGVYQRIRGVDDARASALLGLRADGLRYWVAAARESFEEAGFVLGSGGESLAPRRDEVNARTLSWNTALDQHDVTLDLGHVHVFAHWLTPEGAPRRYDTWFFLAAAPDDQEGAHDDSELVHSEWVRPGDALERCRSREIELIFPTLRSLIALARYTRVDQVLGDVAAAQTSLPLPVIDDSSGQRIRLPGDEEAGSRGWRPLVPALELDFAAERAFFAGEGAA